MEWIKAALDLVMNSQKAQREQDLNKANLMMGQPAKAPEDKKGGGLGDLLGAMPGKEKKPFLSGGSERYDDMSAGTGGLTKGTGNMLADQFGDEDSSGMDLLY